MKEVKLDICSKETCLMIEQKLGGTPLENVGYYTKDDDERHSWNEFALNGLCQAFPQAVVIKYLRLYHNIDIINFHEILGNKEFWWSRIERRYANSLLTEYQQDEEYSSPEESIEEAIKWVYKNILNKEE